MMEDENKWSRWPFLPLTRGRAPDEELGVLVSGQGSTVFLMNLFDAIKDLKACAKKYYAHLEDVVLDGWMVD